VAIDTNATEADVQRFAHEWGVDGSVVKRCADSSVLAAIGPISARRGPGPH
jgi:hypothetical protein